MNNVYVKKFSVDSYISLKKLVTDFTFIIISSKFYM